MSQTLLNMAQQAIKNPSLLAGLIDKYTQQTGSTWAEVAVELQINPAQLARLALCRQPDENPYQEVRKIADYVKMSPIVLSHFFEKVENGVTATSRTSVNSLKTAEQSQKQSNRKPFSIGNNFLSKKYMWPVGMAVVLLLLVTAFVVAQPTAVSEATLIVNNGEATITRAGSGLTADKSYTAVSGEAVVVTAGDTVTTDASTTAQLHLAGGGSVDLLEATSVEITELVTTEESYQVTLTMLAGRTLNRVVHLLGVNDHYDVRTPSSTASVRGTVFMVDVLSQESTHVVVDEGIVNVTMGDQSVDVKAGFEITAVIGELLIVKPQHMEPPIIPTTPAATPTTPPPAPTEEATPTEEAAPTAEPTETPAEVSSKANAKDQKETNAIGMPILPPPAIGTKINPDQPDGGSDTPERPGADHTDDPEDPSTDSNGGNPHDGMVVPGSTSTDSNGSPPAGGAEPPGQGGTPPGQTGNPGNGGDNNGGGNSGDNGNSGGNGGGKKDK